MITVTLSDNETTKEHDADKAHVEEGYLKLFQYARIGKYKCPLLTELVTTYAPGRWLSYSVHKDSK